MGDVRFGPLAASLTVEELEAALITLADLWAGYRTDDLDRTQRQIADKVFNLARHIDDA